MAGVAGTTRGIFALGDVGDSAVDTVEFITIATIGDTTDFGNLTVGRKNPAACSSTTRMINGGGFGPSYSNVMDMLQLLLLVIQQISEI